MKAKYIYTIMMAMALTFGMASCDDDDNNGNTEQQPCKWYAEPKWNS